MTEIHHGGCLCGAVRITVRGGLSPVSFCHCSQCRRQTGHFYATTDAAVDDVSITGEEAISRYRSSPEAERGFCSKCGSALFWRADHSGRMSIMAGLFDMPTGIDGGYHIYCADKGDYYAINDALPQYAASSTV
ncbi:glutathione-dependent formaldehyde-activating GFA [Rhizobium sp. PDO1-076]|uniref:GFA family protein n=1 Tax=Rhizobium sp. PDO1-076 TaxID=1125979 RepID=UPI00024E2733|nr:GFA family protein [Rhizobium sp. PDO1-076]EHS53114.1 glutathione-dependent formaldehyde-activating GFA [Rhizobium sp. PDO1-076]